MLEKKNSGCELEKFFSKKVHSKVNKNLICIVLIDPKFLRSFDCGQIDLCTIEKYSDTVCLKIYEVKSRAAVSLPQMRRLKNSATLLTEIFGKSTIIEVLSLDF